MSRKDHAGKGKAEKEYYSKAIHKQRYDPTIDDSIEFPDTDDPKEDLRVSKTARLQRVGPIEKAKDWAAENWIGLLVSATAVLLMFFVFHFNRDLGRAEGKIELIDSDVKRVSSEVIEVRKDVEEAKRKVEVSSVKLEYVEKDLNNLKEVRKK